mmetsp:Transcript_29964/g.92648  ORF Transcript_29964/g.92648 Transcript_29964/m.92648 type:complete len:237 (-) Transcript_29964:309-1019(-)
MRWRALAGRGSALSLLLSRACLSARLSARRPMTKRSSAAVALPRRCRGDAPRRRARDRPTRKTAAAPLDRVRSLSLRGARTRSHERTIPALSTIARTVRRPGRRPKIARRLAAVPRRGPRTVSFSQRTRPTPDKLARRVAAAPRSIRVQLSTIATDRPRPGPRGRESRKAPRRRRDRYGRAGVSRRPTRYSRSAHAMTPPVPSLWMYARWRSSYWPPPDSTCCHVPCVWPRSGHAP